MVILFSCDKKDNEVPKKYCITGDWKCVSGIEIINNDTVEMFKNEIKYKYWAGDRQKSYSGHLSLSIEPNGLCHFVENIDGLQIDTIEGNIYNYFFNWKLLNTSQSNTHIFMRVYFEYPQVFQEVFKILELTENKLVIESTDEIYYMIYSFDRSNSSCLGDEFSISTIQMPKEIIGIWTLSNSLFETNDSIFTKYENDTLYNQYYLNVHNVPNPVKVIDKNPYQLELAIHENGEILRFEKRGLEIIDNKSYWYWTDETNPHKRIMFRPTYANGYVWCDYEIEFKEDKLLLKNIEKNIEMKFKKK